MDDRAIRAIAQLRAIERALLMPSALILFIRDDVEPLELLQLKNTCDQLKVKFEIVT